MDAKKWWTSKTIWVNGLALVGAIAVAVGMGEAEWAAIAVGAQAIINIFLRSITGESVEWK